MRNRCDFTVLPLLYIQLEEITLTTVINSLVVERTLILFRGKGFINTVSKFYMKKHIVGVNLEIKIMTQPRAVEMVLGFMI